MPFRFGFYHFHGWKQKLCYLNYISRKLHKFVTLPLSLEWHPTFLKVVLTVAKITEERNYIQIWNLMIEAKASCQTLTVHALLQSFMGDFCLGFNFEDSTRRQLINIANCFRSCVNECVMTKARATKYLKLWYSLNYTIIILKCKKFKFLFITFLFVNHERLASSHSKFNACQNSMHVTEEHKTKSCLLDFV